MNEYIQEKIQSFRICSREISAESGYPLHEIEEYEELVKKYTEDMEEAYNRGVEDSLKQIPEPLDYRKQYKEWDEVMRTMKSFEELSHNNCRQQTIDNISKLLNNK